MKTIWKFPLRITDFQRVNMPVDAKVLTVQFQNGELIAWAEVDSENVQQGTHFLVVGTGNPLPNDVDMSDYRYIGTAQQFGGTLVWHVYVEDLDQLHHKSFSIR